jgi:tRNA dimethylallyltransferase
MLDNGWIEEVHALRQLDRPLSATAAQALGYREIGLHLDNLYTFEQTQERIQARTRQFAKRQITWFRHLPGCEPVTKELTWKAWDLKLAIYE